MSGIQIDEKVLEVFEGIRNHSTHKYAVFKVADRKLVLDVIGPHLSTHTKREDSTAFAEVVALLKDSQQPRYALFDFEFPDKEEGRNYKKLSFIFWCPGTSKLKERMLYTANKEFVLKHFLGVSIEFQTNDPDDFDYEDFLHDVKHKASMVQPIR